MLELMLRSVNAIDKLRLVKVAVLRDLGKVPLDGEVVSMAKGQETELPKWLGLVLSRFGYVELRHQQLNVDDVNKYLMSEKGLSKSTLTKLREDFYIQVRELLTRARSNIADVDSIIGIVRLESNLRDLIRLRLNKIVGTALIGAKVEKFEENLTLEEVILFKLLNEVLNQWLNMVLRGT